MAEADHHQQQLVDELDTLAAGHRAAGTERGWRYATTYDLVLDLGRWFTPQTSGAPIPGTAMHCYSVATELAHSTGWAYVEGYALTELEPGHLQTYEHAWVSTPAGQVLDPTWGPNAGLAYLGIPITETFRQQITHRAGTTTAIHAWHSDQFRLARNGIPADAILDIGTPRHTSQ